MKLSPPCVLARLVLAALLVPAALAGPGTTGPAGPPTLAFAPIDRAALLARDEAMDLAGEPGPLRFAEPIPLLATPRTDGAWRTEADGARTWELAIEVPEATDLNFGFRRFALPEGARLTVASADGTVVFPFVAGDETEGQLWTPAFPGSRALLTLTVPAGAPDPVLELSQVGAGYRDILAEIGRPTPNAGRCNIDVVCPQGDLWRNEIRSVVRYQIGGGGLCTASLIVDVPRTFRPFMLTANHCGVSAGSAPSIVVYWNYESTACGGPRDGAGNAITQTGAQFRAALRAPDFALFELDAPPPAAANAYWSGWDRSDVPPNASVPIHHPSGDEKAISFDNDPLTKGDSCIGTGGADTHWYVGQYEAGTTEPGSSGCGLWDADTHLLVGTLSGGGASCSNITYDCYGRFAIHWDSGTSAAQRLSDWLDPAGTGAMSAQGGRPSGATSVSLASIDALDACALGLGDGNGVVEPGETATLIPTLTGSGDFTGVTGTLTTTTPGVTIVDGSATWPDLLGGVPESSDPPHLRLTVDPAEACVTTVDLLLSVSANEGGPWDFPFTLDVGTPRPVPDTPVAVADVATSTSTLSVTDTFTLTGLQVRVQLAHSYVGDIVVSLVSPAGTRVTLIDRPGVPATPNGCADDDMDVTFDDANGTALENRCAGSTPWASGTFKPATPLSAIVGESAAGTWQLVVDDVSAGDEGVITDWELIATPALTGLCQACVDAPCPGQEIAAAVPNVLRVRKGTGGNVILSHPGASSACATGVQVRSAGTARPGAGAGAWPTDPAFLDITPQDTDPGAEFRHVPPTGNRYYLVVEGLPGGYPGPSGSYGS